MHAYALGPRRAGGAGTPLCRRSASATPAADHVETNHSVLSVFRSPRAEWMQASNLFSSIGFGR